MDWDPEPLERKRKELVGRLQAQYGYTKEKADEEARHKLDEDMAKAEPSSLATGEREKRIRNIDKLLEILASAQRNYFITLEVISKVEGTLLSLAPECHEEQKLPQDVLPKPRASVYSRSDSGDTDAPEKEITMSTEKSAEPETIREFECLDNPPLWGQDPKELERQFGVQIEVLHDEPDELSGSYSIYVSGPREAVRAFRKEYVSHHPSSDRAGRRFAKVIGNGPR
jgi:hypothetical protein